MLVEPRVRLADKLPVEPLLPTARFVAADQQDRAAARIEREGDAPDATLGVEPQFLHVRVARPLQGVGARPPERGPERLQQTRVRQQFVLYGLRQAVEFRLERRVEQDGPAHGVLWLKRHMMSNACLRLGRPPHTFRHARAGGHPGLSGLVVMPRLVQGIYLGRIEAGLLNVLLCWQ